MTPSKTALEALWFEVFGEPAPINAEPALLVEFLVRYCPPPPPYGDAATPPEESEGGVRPASA